MQVIADNFLQLHPHLKSFKIGFAGLMGLEMGMGWHPLGGPPGGPPGAQPADPDEEDMVEHFLMFN